MKITDERAEKALRYLVDTDDRVAELRAESERAEFKARAIRDAVFLRLAGSVAERQAEAQSSAEYRDAMEASFAALTAYEAMRNKRTTEAIVIDAWRTAESSRRQGKV